MSQDETNVDEVIETEDATVEEEATEEEQADYSDNEKRLYARLKKEREKRQTLETENVTLKEKETALKQTLSPEPVKEVTPKTDSLSREEAILYAKGLSEEEVTYASKVAQLEGVNVLEATDNEIFKTWKDKRDADSSNSSAQLGASRGSAPHVEKTFAAGMTDADHKQMFQDKFNQ